MMNSLNNMYVPLKPSSYGWKWNSCSSVWEPVWYEGNALPDNCDIQDAQDDDDNVGFVVVVVVVGKLIYPSSGVMT